MGDDNVAFKDRCPINNPVAFGHLRPPEYVNFNILLVVQEGFTGGFVNIVYTHLDVDNFFYKIPRDSGGLARFLEFRDAQELQGRSDVVEMESS